MDYIKQADYEARFGADELAEVLATDTSVTFAAALADAQAIVDSYLVVMPGRSFAVPLDDTMPARIKEIVADLTRYELHAKKPTEEITERRKQAIEFLTALAKGELGLPELMDDMDAGGMTLTGARPVFTARNLRSYVGP